MSKRRKKVLIIMSGIVVAIVGIIVKFREKLIRLFKGVIDK